MIYQSGYLTIKNYDERFRMYTLGFPNRGGEIWFPQLRQSLLHSYSPDRHLVLYRKFIRELESGDVDAFLTRCAASLPVSPTT